MFQKLIKEICHELNIKYKVLSKKWIIRLEKEDKVRYLSGNKFDLNGHAIGNMLDDKYAFYDTLKYLGIPVCEHKIFYHENNQLEEYCLLLILLLQLFYVLCIFQILPMHSLYCNNN